MKVKYIDILLVIAYSMHVTVFSKSVGLDAQTGPLIAFSGRELSNFNQGVCASAGIRWHNEKGFNIKGECALSYIIGVTPSILSLSIEDTLDFFNQKVSDSQIEIEFSNDVSFNLGIKGSSAKVYADKVPPLTSSRQKIGVCRQSHTISIGYIDNNGYISSGNTCGRVGIALGVYIKTAQQIFKDFNSIAYLFGALMNKPDDTISEIITNKNAYEYKTEFSQNLLWDRSEICQLLFAMEGESIYFGNFCNAYSGISLGFTFKNIFINQYGNKFSLKMFIRSNEKLKDSYNKDLWYPIIDIGEEQKYINTDYAFYFLPKCFIGALFNHYGSKILISLSVSADVPIELTENILNISLGSLKSGSAEFEAVHNELEVGVYERYGDIMPYCVIASIGIGIEI